MDVNTIEVVQKILQKAQTDCCFESTQVTKDIDVDIDLGNLLVSDTNPLDVDGFRYAAWAIIEFTIWLKRIELFLKPNTAILKL